MRSAELVCVAGLSLALFGCSARDPADVMADVRPIYSVVVVHTAGREGASGAGAMVRFLRKHGADVDLDDVLAGAEVSVNGQPLPRLGGGGTEVQFGDQDELVIPPASGYAFSVHVPGVEPILVEAEPASTASFTVRSMTAPLGAPLHAAWWPPPDTGEHDSVELDVPDTSFGDTFGAMGSEIVISAQDLAHAVETPAGPPAAPIEGSLVLRRTRSGNGSSEQVFSFAHLDVVPLTITP